MQAMLMNNLNQFQKIKAQLPFQATKTEESIASSEESEGWHATSGYADT